MRRCPRWAEGERERVCECVRDMRECVRSCVRRGKREGSRGSKKGVFEKNVQGV